MINKNVLKSIFSNYHIKKVIYLEEDAFSTFIIYPMSESISLERWTNLETVLKDYLNKEVNLLPLCQAIKFLGETKIKKGVIIEWQFINHYKN